MATVSPYVLFGIRIVVAGDEGTGKSSLIATFAAGNPVKDVLAVLTPTILPKNMSPDGVPFTIIDTSSRYQNICVLCLGFYQNMSSLYQNCIKCVA